MTAAETCLDEQLLARVASGAASDAELSSTEHHLDRCESCRRALAAAASERTLPEQGRARQLEPGLLVGRYRVGPLIGSGGMGVVHEATDPVLERKVALKLLHTPDDPASNARLLREAQVMAKLSHPNLVPVFELGEWSGRVFLAMELVEGTSFDRWRLGGERRAQQKLTLLLDAGRGLAAAHAAGVVHRDFKPANVLVSNDGRARVTDFGLSKFVEGAAAPAGGSMLVTQVGAVMGTPAYMSPEQLDGAVADARSDQFSFCVTIVEALCGARPFRGKTARELREAMAKPADLTGVPRSHRRALARGLSVRPEDRFESMEALIAALSRPSRGGPRLPLAIAAALGVAVLGFGISRTVAEQQVEVVTAAVDLREGQTVSPEQMVVRAVPKRLVTTSVVKPDGIPYIANHSLMFPVQAGDMLLWSHFERMPAKK